MLSSVPGKDHSREAFEAFAPYYDRFTAHHNCDAWTESLLGLARAHGLRGHRALDVGCGTGKSTLPLLSRGFQVTACDHSPAMLAQARTRTGGGADLHLLDARKLPALGRFDLIIALCDIVNYQVDPRELVAMFGGMAANLAPDGVVVFDANTLWIYANFWANHESATAGKAEVRWKCLAGPELAPGGLAIAQVQLVTAVRQENSAHYQRHHPRSVVEGALKAVGLEAVAVRGQFPDGRLELVLDERRHSKAIYVARLRPSDTERR